MSPVGKIPYGVDLPKVHTSSRDISASGYCRRECPPSFAYKEVGRRALLKLAGAYRSSPSRLTPNPTLVLQRGDGFPNGPNRLPPCDRRTFPASFLGIMRRPRAPALHTRVYTRVRIHAHTHTSMRRRAVKTSPYRRAIDFSISSSER